MFRKLARNYLPTTARKAIKRIVSNECIEEGLSLNAKVNSYIARNRHRMIPERENKLMPEIVVPCYKHGRFLEGLLNCTVPLKIPITIVNDCSPDDTDLRVTQLSKEYAFRYLYNEENLNQSGSINRAVSTSSNNLFIILNADDLLMPYWPALVMRLFKESNVSLIGGDSVHFTAGMPGYEKDISHILNSIKYTPPPDIKIYGPNDAVLFEHDNSINMTMSGCAFLRSAWDFVGGFVSPDNRVSRFDDRDFQMRVCCFFDVGISEEFSAFYRKDSSTGRSTV